MLAPRAHLSHDALAPCDSGGYGCDQHELVSTNRTLARLRSEVNVRAVRPKIRVRSRIALPSGIVAYKVQLIYFRQTGKFLTSAETTVEHEDILEIWKAVDDMRRMGRLPGLRPGAGRDLIIIVDVPDHPKRVLQLVMPPFIDEDDVTPPHMPTGDMLPLVRVPLDEIPRTTTRDIVRIDLEAEAEADTVVASDDDVTPPDQAIPKPPDKTSG